LALAASVIYIRYCFFRARRRSKESGRTVYFARGTFTRDVHALKKHQDVVIDANILKRFFSLIVGANELQQVVCMYYEKRLHKAFMPVISSFVTDCKRSEVQSICFGGIDYFEVIIFNSGARDCGVESVAIFHENYTIPIVKTQTKNLISSYPNVQKFSRVYAIGPPATDILKLLYDDVRPHGSGRFNYTTDCCEFDRDILLIPFAEIPYFATVAFLITYALMLDLVKSKSSSILVKHKNRSEKRRFIKSFGRDASVCHVNKPSASESCATSRVVVCFNSLVYFEALACGHLIALPAFAEAKQAEVYSQHELLPEAHQAGIRYFSSLEDLAEILLEAQALLPTDRLRWAEPRRKLLNEAFY
jgi:hypothetical protein